MTEEAAIAAKIASFADAAGYEWVDAPILQPARIYIDQSSEDLRRRTFIFTAPDGEELCLRPEQTIPISRVYLERSGDRLAPAQFAYDGAVFRQPPAGVVRAREYRQMGVERFGGADALAEDAHVFAAALAGCQAADAGPLKLSFGDLGLFRALIDGLEAPQPWRDRLKRAFAHPAQFGRLLESLEAPGADGEEGLLQALVNLEPTEAQAAIRHILGLAGIETVGGRTVTDIAERFLEKAAGLSGGGLPKGAIDAIKRFLAVSGAPDAALAGMQQAARDLQVDLSPALARAEKRFEALKAAGADLAAASFSAAFGRRFDYYTDFVFEITSPHLAEGEPLAAGGRYDSLLENLGGPRAAPAVGCMMRPDRIARAAVLEGGRS